MEFLNVEIMGNKKESAVREDDTLFNDSSNKGINFYKAGTALWTRNVSALTNSQNCELHCFTTMLQVCSSST